MKPVSGEGTVFIYRFILWGRACVAGCSSKRQAACCLHGKVCGLDGGFFWVVFLRVQFRQRQEGAFSNSSHEKEKERERERKALGVSAGILMTSIMQSIIGSNWGAIILHLQSNVSLNMKACADASAFFFFWLLCLCVLLTVWKVPWLKIRQLFNPVPLSSTDKLLYTVTARDWQIWFIIRLNY